MRVVVALGGNALAPRDQPLTIASQRAAVTAAAGPLARLAAQHDLVVTHGNGPQVGLLSLQAAALDAGNDFTLDVLDAESAGLIGHLLELAIANRLPPDREVVTLLTRTLVDAADPAFAHPTKFVGPRYDPDAADRLAAEHGWRFAVDGTRLRRVVASPAPRSVLPMATVGVLLDLGRVVVCGGGGGVPVVERDGVLEDVEAVVDKDAVSALLAEGLGADVLVVATDVTAVHEGWGTPASRPIDRLEAADGVADRFAAGSMGPKVAAACAFARGGGRAVIGALADLDALVAGTAGTTVVAPSALLGRPVA